MSGNAVGKQFSDSKPKKRLRDREKAGEEEIDAERDRARKQAQAGISTEIAFGSRTGVNLKYNNEGINPGLGLREKNLETELAELYKRRGLSSENAQTFARAHTKEIGVVLAKASPSSPASAFKEATILPSHSGKKTDKRPVSLPELPTGLEWPTDTFSEAHESHGWDIVRYLEERWLPILEAGRKQGRIFASRRILADRDPSAIIAIKNYTRLHPETGKRRELPDTLHFPTLKETNDIVVAAISEQAGDALRIAVNRSKRSRQP